MPGAQDSGRRARFYGWWYISIGAGFLLLALRAWLLGDRPWLVALRFVIAAGFAALGWLQLRAAASRH